tara:strand:+ start:111 stop:470 length:360 start_codon:yes stop_codon:yes gene_type:complete
MKKLTIFILSVVLLGSCNKYSEKVAGTYSGQMTINDSVISSNANIIISEISNNRISIESNFFTLYDLEIEKQRYFSSVTYFHNGDLGRVFEIGETSTGFFLSLVHYDNLNNQYIFSGEN